MTRREALVAAVNVFIDEIEESSPNSSISLTTYSTTATRDTPLTPVFDSIRADVNAIAATGFTNIFEALTLGSDSLEEDPLARRFADKTVVLMTDGVFNVGGTPIPSAILAASRNQTVHTITFSEGANQAAMAQVAAIGGGIHVHADDGSSLADAFREIALTLSVITIE